MLDKAGVDAIVKREQKKKGRGQTNGGTHVDDCNDTNAEIQRLAKLRPIEYDRERTSAAKKLGIARVSTLDSTVKAARGENAETRGQGRPLEMPTIEPWPESINGADLLNAICNAVKRYLVVPEGSAEVLALWAIHTHAFECFAHSPRLAVTSPEKQCGKTTTLDVLRELVVRPLPTSNATTAAVFRTIEMATPTLLIDEADTFLRENEELRGVLNSGHRQGGQIIRTVGEAGTQRERDSTFKGYLLTAFAEAFATYLPPESVTPSQCNNHGHCDALQTVTPEKFVTLSKSQKPNNDGHCDVVTVLNPPTDAKRCEHCHGGGNVLQCAYGEVSPWLHRECVEPWIAAYEERRQQQLRARLPTAL